MSDIHWRELTDELKAGAVQKGHPFHFCTFATVGLENMPRLRTIVLRKVQDDLRLVFFTDRRSKKIMHIKENRKVSLLFYHPEKLVQVKVEGLASILADPESVRDYQNDLEESGKKDYTTVEAPGSIISQPDTIDYLKQGDYFCAVEVQPFVMEYLQLRKPNHLRVRFTFEAGEWQREFLVP